MKKFTSLHKENKKDLYEYGIVMAVLNIDGWSEVTSIIKKDDIYNPDGKKGIEKDPHITLLFGLHPSVESIEIENIIDRFREEKIEINTNGISIFENSDFDVVKIGIDCPILYEINKELTDLPHTTDYPDYKPHITIAYVKSGCGKKYIDPNFDKKFTIKNISYSRPLHEKRILSISSKI